MTGQLVIMELGKILDHGDMRNENKTKYLREV